MATIKEIIVRVRSDVSGLQAGLNSAASSVSRFGQGMSRTGRTLQSHVSVPLAAAGAASVKMAYDFEESFVSIGALVGASRKQIDEYQRSVLKLSSETAQAPKDLADALYFVTSSGFEGASALKVLEASAKASAAGLGETQQVADAVTSAVNAYGEESLSAAAATDVLVGAVREGKGEASELAGVIGRVIPLSSELGVSFQDVGAAMASMTLSGLDAAEATTALRGIFTTLLKPSQDGEKALRKMGLTVEALRDSMAENGLLETLLLLKDRVGENDEALAAIFPNVRALTGFLNLTGKNAAKNSEIFKELRNDVDATGKAFDEMAKSEGFKMRDALNELRIEAIKLGKQLIPIIVDDVIPAFRSALKWWRNLSPASKDLALKLAGLAILAGPVLRLAGGVTQLAGGMMRLGGSLGGTGAAGVAGKLTGIAGALTRIGRLGAAAVVLEAVVDAVRSIGDMDRYTASLDKWLDRWQSLPSVFGGASGSFDKLFELLDLRQSVDGWNDGIDAIRVGARDAKTSIADTLGALRQLAEATGIELPGNLAKLALEFHGVSEAVQMQLGDAFAQATDLGGKMAGKLVGVTERINDMRGPLSNVERGYLAWFLKTGQTSEALEYLREILGDAKNATKDQGKASKDAGKAADRYANDIRGAGNAAKEAEGKVRPYGRALGAVPKRVHTRVTADVKQAREALGTLLGMLSTLKGGAAIAVRADIYRRPMPGAQHGAYVSRTGVALVHRGEKISGIDGTFGERGRGDDTDRALKVVIGRDQVVQQLTYWRDFSGRD